MGEWVSRRSLLAHENNSEALMATDAISRRRSRTAAAAAAADRIRLVIGL